MFLVSVSSNNELISNILDVSSLKSWRVTWKELCILCKGTYLNHREIIVFWIIKRLGLIVLNIILKPAKSQLKDKMTSLPFYGH